MQIATHWRQYLTKLPFQSSLTFKQIFPSASPAESLDQHYFCTVLRSGRKCTSGRFYVHLLKGENQQNLYFRRAHFTNMIFARRQVSRNHDNEFRKRKKYSFQQECNAVIVCMLHNRFLTHSQTDRNSGKYGCRHRSLVLCISSIPSQRIPTKSAKAALLCYLPTSTSTIVHYGPKEIWVSSEELVSDGERMPCQLNQGALCQHANNRSSMTTLTPSCH